MTLESWANVAKRFVSCGEVASLNNGGAFDIVCWASVGLILPPLASVYMMRKEKTLYLTRNQTHLYHP